MANSFLILTALFAVLYFVYLGVSVMRNQEGEIDRVSGNEFPTSTPPSSNGGKTIHDLQSKEYAAKSLLSYRKDRRDWLRGIIFVFAILVVIWVISTFQKDSISLELTRLVLTFCILLVLDFTFAELPVRNKEVDLKEIQERLAFAQLKDDLSKECYLKEWHQKLKSKIAHVLFDDQKRRDTAKESLKLAAQTLSNSKFLDEASFNKIISFYDVVEEEILRGQREQKDQRNWLYLILAVMLFFIGVVATAMYFISDTSSAQKQIPILGVPVSIVTWAAMGSLAAMLYRFHNKQPEDKVTLIVEIRWLIARPMIGILMGTIASLALISGLLLLGTTPATGNASTTGNPIDLSKSLGIYWIIAFIAGFSDRFYLAMIDLLLRGVGNEPPAPGLSQTEQHTAKSTGETNQKQNGEPKPESSTCEQNSLTKQV